MKIGDRVYVAGYIDEIRKDVVIIRNDSGYFGTEKHNVFVAESVKKREAQGKWIPCSERLPENNIDVLISDNVGHVEIGRYIKGLWFDYDINEYGIQDENFDLEVVAWMPLPEPYCSMEENYGFPSKEEAELWMDSKQEEI